ncbi:hypothetical protein [Poriferisphaera sp. WC338]|uniref:hypothetical protein n=1 Tax=Poriferisphaera sp. WC338 TaxID=3425129 RepID=UPI003D81C3C6
MKRQKQVNAQELAAIVELVEAMETLEMPEEEVKEEEVEEELPEPEELVEAKEPEPEPEPEIDEEVIKPEPEPIKQAETPEPEPEPEPMMEPEPVEQAAVEEPAPQEEPKLEMERMFESQQAETEAEDIAGDFARATEGKPSPVLRIDWGDMEEALNVIRSGGMRLVVYEGMNEPIDLEYVLRGGEWRKQRLRVGRRERYSNRLRIVHEVPAFSGVVQNQGWQEGNQLAVMLPRPVEQMLQKAQLTALSRKGLTMSGVHSFAGKFSLQKNKRLDFEITAIHVRTQ